MLVVSGRLLACRRLISSLMLTLGIRAHVLELLDLGFELRDRLFEVEKMRLPWRKGTLTQRPSANEAPGADRWRPIEHLDAGRPDQALELLEQLARGAHPPLPARLSAPEASAR